MIRSRRGMVAGSGFFIWATCLVDYAHAAAATGPIQATEAGHGHEERSGRWSADRRASNGSMSPINLPGNYSQII